MLLARFRTNVKQWDLGGMAGWVRGKVGDESIIVAGAIVPIARAPRFDLADPDAYNGLVIRSEFGLFPYVFYIQWKTYF